MLPDSRLRAMLREIEALPKADPQVLESIYSHVEMARRRRTRRFGSMNRWPGWVPAMAGAAAAIVLLVTVVRLLPDQGPAASASPDASRISSPSALPVPSVAPAPSVDVTLGPIATFPN